MSAPSPPPPPPRQRPVFLPSLSERTLTSQSSSPNSKEINRKRATSADYAISYTCTAQERRHLFLEHNHKEYNNKKNFFGKSLKNVLSLKSPKRKSKPKSFFMQEEEEEEEKTGRNLPATSIVAQGGIADNTSSLSLVSNQTCSFSKNPPIATSTNPSSIRSIKKTSLKSSTSSSNNSICNSVDTGCGKITACSTDDTVKHSNIPKRPQQPQHNQQQQQQQQRKQLPESVCVNVEKAEEKGRLKKAKQKIKRVIHNAFGNNTSETLPKKSNIASSPEKRRSEAKVPSTPPSSGRSSSIFGIGTPKSKSRQQSDSPSPKSSPAPSPPQEQSRTDEAIQGRLDGIDILALDANLTYSSFTTSKKSSTQELVQQMLITACGGKDVPEVVLEGVLNGSSNRCDRWTVPILSNFSYQEGKREMRRKSTTKREVWQKDLISKHESNKVSQTQTTHEKENYHCTPRVSIKKKQDAELTPPTSVSTIATAVSSEDEEMGAAAYSKGCFHSLPSVDYTTDDDDEDHESLGENGSGYVKRIDYYNHLTTNNKNVNVNKNNDEEEQKKEDEDALLLLQMWGRDETPPPSHNVPLLSSNATENIASDDKPNSNNNSTLTTLLASCPCPIDIDEDAFVIDNVLNLQALHDVIQEAIKRAMFHEALLIFEKMLRGLKGHYNGNGKSGSGCLKLKKTYKFIGSTLHNMGIVCMWSEKYEDALRFFDEACEVRKGFNVGENHPDFVVSLVKKGMVHYAMEQLDKAQTAFEQALAIRKTILDRDHLEVAKILNNIGCVMYHKGHLVNALESFTAALNIQRTWLEGPIRRESIVFDTSVTLGNMGKVFFERNDLKLSLNIFEEALILQTTAFRKDHDIVLTTLSNLAFVKAQSGEEENAIKLHNGVLRAQNSKYGCNSQRAVETKGLMSRIFVQQKKYEEALQCLSGVLQWQRENLEQTHPAVLKAKKTIEKLERASEDDVSVWI